ncbi:antitoxin Xre/MbcA/ParS toxin-binding domain-containing protein [Pseudomonas guariconensis]|uniref:type II RES/Xre toxin-antitoxin system antitoxin n=1 Tax=Pseudomonas guariconensis TaxID=1288410 RepID=UPI0034675904
MIETTKKPTPRRARYATIEGGRKATPGSETAGVFWGYTQTHDQRTEAQRLAQIRDGLSAKFYLEVKRLFGLPEKQVAELFNASISTLERRVRDNQPLDAVASERLDRIAEITHQAVAVFESEEQAVAWMSRPNDALGVMTPVMLCQTEIGARQVRRVLAALEWGGVV